MILAGGVGSRFWPVSTPARPKQLLALAGDDPLITQTVMRIEPLVSAGRIRILTGEQLAPQLLAALPRLDRRHLMVEPRVRGTAPVLAWAAHEIARTEPSAVMASLHADHVIEPAGAFRDLLARVAVIAVADRRLFTIGVVPTRPETGFGYIQRGAPLSSDPESNAVQRFVEKPGRSEAEAYLREGYLWNTGIFVWPAALLLEQLERHTPEVASHLGLLREGRVAEFFERVPTLSIDEGLLQRSDRVAVAAATFRWDDVGAWDAVARTRLADSAGNVAVGDAHLVDATGCIAWSESGSVVVFGARDLVVVRAGHVTLVMPRVRAPELKQLLDRLPGRLVRPDGE